ncbi:MAG TPA: pteridine reductase [Gammaproteobacteria bacterium]|nr:pteridine reductase [Gammaproteobacteria bacterium]
MSGNDTPKVALITGAAHRVGAAIAETLHRGGMNVVVHYRHSREAAEALQRRLVAHRAASVVLLRGDLLNSAALPALVGEAAAVWGRLDVLVNNASSFYPTPLGEVSEAQWDDLLGTNLKAPFFLAQAAAPLLTAAGGAIVNIVDIHAERPLKNHPVYSIAKAGLVMLTRALARELGPAVRVNAVAPGAILWPEHGASAETRHYIISRTALKRQGDPLDVARAVRYLVQEADYMTGQVLTVDGGRSLSY